MSAPGSNKPAARRRRPDYRTRPLPPIEAVPHKRTVPSMNGRSEFEITISLPRVRWLEGRA